MDPFVTDQVDLGRKTAARTTQRMVNWLLELRRLRPPSNREPLPLFPPTGGGPAGSDDGPVDARQVVIDLALVVQFVQQRGGDTGLILLCLLSVQAYNGV